MIKFSQDFTTDFNQIYMQGEPYAFIRYGDGERAFCTNRVIGTNKPTEHWKYDGTRTKLARKAYKALTADIPGLYIGISCPCCDIAAHAWYLQHVTLPKERLTYANLFVNANYPRFKKLDLSNTVLVSCKNGDFTVPQNAINPEWDYQPLLRRLFAVDKTILISAGPMKCALIYDYWTQAPKRQIIIDVGSAVDMRVHGVMTRQYHNPTSKTAGRICRWH